MNLRICILKSQPLKDGRLKIRIAIAHNRETRYFVTDFSVSSEKNFKNGQVTGKEDGAKEINLKLQAMLTRIQNAFDQIDGAAFFSCAEIVEIIKDKLKGTRPKTILEVMDLQIERRTLQGRRSNTMRNYTTARNTIERFFGNKSIQSLNEDDLLRFRAWMDSCEHISHASDQTRAKKKYGYSPSTQRLILDKLKSVYDFGIKQKFFIPDRDIWDGLDIPQTQKRDCDLTIDELRRLRDLPLSNPYLEEVRDLLMLSFYLCGMNLTDLVKQDLSQETIRYRRVKTSRTRPQDEHTEFTIQPEAKDLIHRFYKNGSFTFRDGVGWDAICHALQRKLPEIQKECQIETRLVYYSMRKTFSQLCIDLGVPDAVNAYCIGDTPPTKTLNFYRSANRQLADKFIRNIFDFVGSDQSLEEAINNL